MEEQQQQFQLTPLKDISRKRDYDKTNVNIFSHLDLDENQLAKGINIGNPLLANKLKPEGYGWYDRPEFYGENRMIPNEVTNDGENQMIPFEKIK